jgi:uncharacterized membrane protein
MFLFPKNLKPTPAKRVVYLVASTVLGILLSVIAHVVVEKFYLDWAIRNGKAIVWYSVFDAGQCALHPAIQIGLLVVGALAGLLIGRLWWRLVYIDRIWSKDKAA